MLVPRPGDTGRRDRRPGAAGAASLRRGRGARRGRERRSRDTRLRALGVTLPAPAAVLQHGPEARLVRTIERLDEQGIACASRGRGPWPWFRMLEGAAQTAGLLLGIGRA